MQLFLVRHGHSPFTAATDHQRPLSELGQAQARQAGQFIQGRTLQPPLIVCSNATRTRQTAAAIGEVLGSEQINAHPHLYHALVGDWCDVISEQAHQEALVLVGHNPTMSQLAQYLNPLHQSPFSPACVAHLALEIAADGLKLPARPHDFFKPDAQ